MKMKHLVFFTLTIISLLTISSTQGSTVKSSNDSTYVGKDTINLSNQTIPLEEIHFSKKEIIYLLEKKNSTETFLSIFITALGVLFTVMAIVVAIVIYMQSREFKNKLAEATDKYKLIINTFIDSKREDLKTQEENLTKLISEYTEKLKSTKSQPDQENKIKEIISELENKKQSVEKQLNSSIVKADYVLPDYYPSDIYGSSGRKYHKCSKCGFGFLVGGFGYGIDVLSASTAYMYNPAKDLPNSKKVATCPSCGNVDVVF